MQAEALLKVIANQLIVMNKLKHIELLDRAKSANDKDYQKERAQSLYDLETMLYKDWEYIK